MTRTRQWLLLAGAGAVAALLGYALGQHARSHTPAIASGFTFKLPDLAGHMRTLSSYKGKVVLVNFWATWCPPCRKEIPLLISAERRYAGRGVEIVGIAVDNPGKVRAFSAQFHINYPVLLGQGTSVELMKRAGDGAGLLPYSVVFSRKGHPVAVRTGGFTRQSLQHVLTVALRNTGQAGAPAAQ
jgi:thiol-disulfide isomerase/thioredoxin